jgi:uncharacterized protein YegL
MENEGGLIVQPLYLVCDESSSMSNDGINAVNAGIGELCRTIVADPVVDAKARVGIISFNSQAEVALPLSQLSSIVQIPRCARSDEPARYASVFNLLKKEIDVDVPRLKREGFRVCRPIVLFVSGSIPTDPDEWRDAYKDLSDESYRFHPIVFSLGLQGSHPNLLKEIATKTSVDSPVGDALVFLVNDVQDTKAIEEFFRELLPPSLAIWGDFHSHEDLFRSYEKQLGINLNALVQINGISRFCTPRTWLQYNSITRSTYELSGGVSVLPFYIVCDEGSSMIGESIEAVNAGIGELFRTIHGDPVVDAKARVGIITFNDQANVLLPLTQLSLITQSPGCVASGSTSYASVFNLLKKQIETDIPRLKSQGFRVHRPMVFFMSDGQPNAEDWQSPLAQLTDANFHFHPNIVSFGVAGAEPSVIKEVSTPLTVGAGKKQSFAFLAQDGVNPGSALREIMKFITGTIIASARQDQPTMAIDKDQLADMGVLIIDSV